MLVPDNPTFHSSTSYSTTSRWQEINKKGIKTDCRLLISDCCQVHCHLTERMLLAALRKQFDIIQTVVLMHYNSFIVSVKTQLFYDVFIE
jgi:hypothetical protein